MSEVNRRYFESLMQDKDLSLRGLAKIKDGPTVMATVKRGYRAGTHNLAGPYAQDNVALEAATPVLVTRN